MTSNDIFKGTVFDPGNPMPMLVCSVAIGFFMGILFDAFSVSEKLFGKKWIIAFFTDFFAVTSCWLLLFCCAYNFSSGIIRWYCYAFGFAGYKAYKKLLSRIVRKIIDFWLKIIEKTANFIFAAISRPLIRLYGLAQLCYRRINKKRLAAISVREYNREKQKYVKLADKGFNLSPLLYGDKKWKNTKLKKMKARAENR